VPSSQLQRALAELGVSSDTLSDEKRDSLDRNGYAVFESLLPVDTVEGVRSAIIDLEEREDAAGAGTNQRDSGAIRIDDVNHKGAAFDLLWLHPVLLACMEHYLGDFRLSSVTSRAARPGMGHQNMHVDYWGALEDGYVACNSGWMLDDFAVENGATRVVPGSHLWGTRPEDVMDDPKATHPDEVRVTAPAGSLVVFNGYLWHSGTHNGSESPRRGVFQVYSRRDVERQNDHAALITPELAERLSPAARYVLDA
jgi:ectoine hydroxylase-related dioxygenase (phytanoyl-CoA dioxygenase family)